MCLLFFPIKQQCTSISHIAPLSILIHTLSPSSIQMKRGVSWDIAPMRQSARGHYQTYYSCSSPPRAREGRSVGGSRVLLAWEESLSKSHTTDAQARALGKDFHLIFLAINKTDQWIKGKICTFPAMLRLWGEVGEGRKWNKDCFYSCSSEWRTGLTRGEVLVSGR